MAVQDAQAPGREDEEPCARKEDPYQRNGELPLFTAESGGDQVDQQRGLEHTGEHQCTYDEAEEAGDGACDTPGFVATPLGEEAGVDRDERCGKGAFAEQVLQKIRNPEGDRVGVGGVRDAEVVREDPLSHQAGEPAEQDTGAYQEGRGA